MQAITPQVRLIANQMLEYRGKAYRINSSTNDTIHVFTKSICLYVLTINRPLGYIGLDVYYPSVEDPINTIFLHSDYQIKDALGLKWKNLSPGLIATRLHDYLI